MAKKTHEPVAKFKACVEVGYKLKFHYVTILIDYIVRSEFSGIFGIFGCFGSFGCASAVSSDSGLGISTRPNDFFNFS